MSDFFDSDIIREEAREMERLQMKAMELTLAGPLTGDRFSMQDCVFLTTLMPLKCVKTLKKELRCSMDGGKPQMFVNSCKVCLTNSTNLKKKS